MKGLVNDVAIYWYTKRNYRFLCLNHHRFVHITCANVYTSDLSQISVVHTLVHTTFEDYYSSKEVIIEAYEKLHDTGRLFIACYKEDSIKVIMDLEQMGLEIGVLSIKEHKSNSCEKKYTIDIEKDIEKIILKKGQRNVKTNNIFLNIVSKSAANIIYD